jgi:hypothetical protein
MTVTFKLERLDGTPGRALKRARYLRNDRRTNPPQSAFPSPRFGANRGNVES